VTSLNPQTVFISNERNNWITATGKAHPITAADYRKALSGSAGALLNRLSRHVPAGTQRVLVILNPYAPINRSGTHPAHSRLPFTLAVNVPAIGVIGYLAGDDVYIFDSYSLANPIGSHTIIVKHARPGHEKYLGPAWMVARFGTTGLTTSSSIDGVPAGQVDDARRALDCPPLSSYLHAITTPLTASGFFSDLGNAWHFTTMSFSADPNVAATQLCGLAAPGGAATPR